MAACDTQTFVGVSSAAWECLKAKAATEGITITADVGNYTQSGFTVAWSYDRNSQKLAMACTDRPFWAPCSTVNSKIHEFVEGSGCFN
jgi:hypothetical protein